MPTIVTASPKPCSNKTINLDEALSMSRRAVEIFTRLRHRPICSQRRKRWRRSKGPSTNKTNHEHLHLNGSRTFEYSCDIRGRVVHSEKRWRRSKEPSTNKTNHEHLHCNERSAAQVCTNGSRRIRAFVKIRGRVLWEKEPSVGEVTNGSRTFVHSCDIRGRFG